MLLCWALTGCPTRPSQGPNPVSQPARELAATPAHEGRPFDIVSGDSLVRILVFRAGPLAKAGHNHVIASHAVTGTIYVPADPLHTTFELHIPVAELTVDEPGLRASENSPDFPPEVPDSAKEGTRRNMLSEALLDGTRYAEIILRTERLERAEGSPAAAHAVTAHVQVEIRGQRHSMTVPVRYELESGTVVASGELPLRQTELGLTPFSALLGALQVQDEMQVKFRIMARATTPSRPVR
jgi:hypothetical protein